MRCCDFSRKIAFKLIKDLVILRLQGRLFQRAVPLYNNHNSNNNIAKAFNNNNNNNNNNNSKSNKNN